MSEDENTRELVESDELERLRAIERRAQGVVRNATDPLVAEVARLILGGDR